MEREPVRQSQSDHGNATNGASRINNTTSTTTISTTPTPTPPRLTPNPTLLDSTHPAAQTPTSSPPPPPLTPAPSLSASHVPKTVAAAAAVAGAPPPHILAPAPPRLTSTGTPILRTYSRPILPSPMAAPKMPSSAPAAAILALSSSSSLRLSARSPLVSNVSSSSSSSSSPTVASTPPLPFSPTASSVSPSVTHGDATAPPKSSAVLTNGNARPISTHTSTAITPFHTPASPTGRQVTQALGTPGLVRANQIPTPVRQRVSQQALLLGKGLKGSGQDQALLRAQMLILTSAMRPSPSSSSRPSSSSTPSSHPASAQLQSLTLRPPPPGMLTIPPSLRLKRPISSSAPPPLSRGRTPLFPPLRPRPQPGTTATESLAMPIRPHLSVPPPTLYSPVRAVPLRPRLHSPNGHSGAPIRQSPALQPITASAPAHTSQAPPINRHLVTLKACPLSQANQSQHAALSMAASPFERSPSAARQLQIIALSSGRQSQQGNSVHTYASVQSTPSTTVETPEPGGQLQRTLGSGDTPPLLHQPLNPSMPKTTSSSSSSPPLSSPPSLLCPSSPGGPSFGPAPPQTHGLLVRQGEKQGGEEQREKGRGGAGCGSGEEDIVGKDMRVNVRDDQRGAEAKEEEEERKGPASNMKTIVTDPLEQRSQTVTDQVERMEVTEEGERVRERTVGGEKEEEQDVERRETPMDQAENLTIRNVHRHQNSEPNNPEPNSHPATIQNSLPEPKAMMPGLVATSSVPELSAQNQRLAEAQREPISHEDLCENMSTQSDNQSALSSLSSQSPPSSPFITPSSDRTPFLPPTSAQPARPDNLSLPLHQPDKITQSQEEAEKNLDRSEDESEGNERWAPRPWPEGRQVLTHLVEGFVIQEGLQPFPVNRSSLLVESEQSATTPQEVNGTNGTAVFPETQQPERTEQEHSTDTDEGEGEGGATDDPGGTSQKDKVVLHCQFCGKRGHAHNFMRSKRFCSTSCARGFNVRLTKRLRALSAGSRPERPRPPLQRAESVPGKPLLLRLSRDSLQPRVLWTATRREAEEKGEEEEEEDDDEKDGEEADEEEPAVVMTTKAERRGAARRTRRTASEPAMTTTAPTTPTTTYKPVPAHWSVEEVTTFIHTLPGCSEVAEAFRVQEIDGQALLLLTEDHLMTSLNIKLGPALKICAHINALKHQ